MSDIVLTSVKGTNADLFKQVWSVYGDKSYKVLDTTWGRGIFWRDIDHKVLKNDLDPKRGDTHHDSRALPADWTDKFDFTVYDPPYMHSQKYGTVKASLSSVYNNNLAKTDSLESVGAMYAATAKELHRVTKHKGLVAVKCMDSIESGKQKRLHIWVWQDFIKAGFRDEDLFILTPNSTPIIRWPQQKHARKNNSFLWLFRVWKK